MDSEDFREDLVEELRDEFARRLDLGVGLEQVHADIINPVFELTEDEQAALWLFAWSYAHARQRVSRSPHRVP